MFLWRDYRWHGDSLSSECMCTVLDTPLTLPQWGLLAETMSLPITKSTIQKRSKSDWK